MKKNDWGIFILGCKLHQQTRIRPVVVDAYCYILHHIESLPFNFETVSSAKPFIFDSEAHIEYPDILF